MHWSAALLPRSYFPGHAKNRMRSEGNLQRARAEFFRYKCTNLRFLLKGRYRFLNEYIAPGNIVIEIGAGAGFAAEFINEKVITTEILPHPWIDLCLDGLHLPFAAEAIDVAICANVLHHFSSPIKFLHGLRRCLKPGGYAVILEPNPSLLLLLALLIMRHEGWSFDVDVFDPTAVVNDPADPWSGNNAVSGLMFDDAQAFRKNLPGFEVVDDRFAECIMFPLSGGVTAKSKTIECPIAVLKAVDWIDRQLCWLSPKIFAMGRLVVLRKAAS